MSPRPPKYARRPKREREGAFDALDLPGNVEDMSVHRAIYGCRNQRVWNPVNDPIDLDELDLELASPTKRQVPWPAPDPSGYRSDDVPQSSADRGWTWESFRRVFPTPPPSDLFLAAAEGYAEPPVTGRERRRLADGPIPILEPGSQFFDQDEGDGR